MKYDLPPDTFRTIRSVSSATYKEKGSRFIANAFPVSSEDDIKSDLAGIKKEHHGARHNCYAYILGREGITWRVNDDGEPSGTAGKPILGQIREYGLSNILVIVTRYFGGTLLGTSGLFNAYRTAAHEALKNAEIIDHQVHEFYKISFGYDYLNDVMKILKEESVSYTHHQFDLECTMDIGFRESLRDRIIARLSRIEGLICKFLEAR